MYRMVYNTENRYDEELERKKAWMNRGDVKLPPYVLEGFESDGFFVLHEAFNAYDVQHLERQVAMNVFGRQCSGRLGQLLSGRFCPDSLWVDDVYLKTLWERSHVSSLAAQMLKCSSIRLITDNVYGTLKNMHPASEGQWHKDHEHFNVVGDSDPGISVWIPLSDGVNETKCGGAVHLVNRSKVSRRECLERPFVTPDCQAELDASARVPGTVNGRRFMRGDILLYNRNTFHKLQPATEVQQSKWRWGTAPPKGCPIKGRLTLIGHLVCGESASYQPGEHACARKNTCAHGLQQNDSLNSPCFPQLFPKYKTRENKAWKNGTVQISSATRTTLKCATGFTPIRVQVLILLGAALLSGYQEFRELYLAVSKGEGLDSLKKFIF
jgi:hypothetical protein